MSRGALFQRQPQVTRGQLLYLGRGKLNEIEELGSILYFDKKVNGVLQQGFLYENQLEPVAEAEESPWCGFRRTRFPSLPSVLAPKSCVLRKRGATE